MANTLFSFTSFDFSGTLQGGDDCPFEEYERGESMFPDKQHHHSFSMEELGQVYPLCSELGASYQHNTHMVAKGLDCFKEQEELLLQQPILPPPPSKSNCLSFDEYFASCFGAPAQRPSIQENKNIFKSGAKDAANAFSLSSSSSSSSLDLLNSYGNGIKKLNVNLSRKESNETFAGGSQKKLSTEEVMKVAGARFIQFSDQRFDDFSMLMHPFGYALSGLSEEETMDVELAHLLLATAEKVGYQQYDRASRLLTRCEWIASERANPVQRVVYCFAQALREKIDKATGRYAPKDSHESSKCEIPHGLGTNIAYISFHQKVPFNQILHITEIQAIIENMGSARKVHLIDLEIRSGVQWTALMQALTEREQRPLELLRVTAVGLIGIHKLEEIGKRLESFAKSMNFPFKFKAVYVANMSDIKEEQFKTAADESVVVVCNLILRTLISRPDCLENLMRVIKNLNPLLMVVGEVEANHNSPVFVNRFIEALFFYSSYFDCLETCMDQNCEHKKTIEAAFRSGIRNIIAAEGHERIARNVKMEVWRAFFARFRMVEIGFSESSIYQASLVPKQFPHGDLCYFDTSGKALIIGWKGTSLHSISAWKFPRERFGRSSLPYSL